MTEKSNRHRQAVVYVRVAHAPGDSNEATTAQRETCRRIAERHGLNIIREYADPGRPARFEQQSELRQLLDHLTIWQDVAHVIVADYTRLSRNLRVLDDILERIQACGAQVVTLSGVEVAERFTKNSSMLEVVAEPFSHITPAGLFPLALIRAAFHGLATRQNLIVTTRLPSGETVKGIVIGVGSRLGIHTTDGTLIEDVRAEWIVRCDAQTND
jgi:hypothetical protein